ncbi:MAG: aromatic ring-opening dioxygenase LigA [Microbacterium sp.]
MVSGQLRAENIVVPDDAMAFRGQVVAAPFTAFVHADIIQHHALSAADGKTYAELAQDDPVRTTMMNASFLRASLFTSVVSFGALRDRRRHPVDPVRRGASPTGLGAAGHPPVNRRQPVAATARVGCSSDPNRAFDGS